MNHRRLTEFFNSRRQRAMPLALATVYETSGSTYSKPGARMLIDEQGIFQGMLSGGCLEGDLAIRARLVIESGLAQLVSYDLADDNDELWGLGVGCDGMMRILLQPLTAEATYEPYATIANLQSGREPAISATVLESSVDGIGIGATCITWRGSDCSGQFPGEPGEIVREQASMLLASAEAAVKSHQFAGGAIRVAYASVEPDVRVLVLGAGLDAQPVVRFAGELGWRCTVVDHRPAYVDNNDFADAEKVLCCPASDLAASVTFDDFDLAVVMSHNLASDRAYLEQLADSNIGYVGLLGPAGRRERLLSDLGDRAEELHLRLHGPAGIDLGGRGPAAIALSIVAEMQKALSNGRA